MTSRMKRRLLAVVLITAATIVIAVVAIDWKLRADLNTAREQWRAAGGILVLADAKPVRRIAEEDDAAPVYRRAFEAMTPLNSDQKQILSALEDEAAASAILTENVEAIQLARQAASLPACDWRSRVYEDGMSSRFGDLPKVRSLALLLDAEARIRARQQDFIGAAESIEAMLGIAGHASSDPWMVPLIVRLSIAHLALDSLRDSFADADVPERLASIIAQPDGHRAEAIRAFQLEGAMGIKVFDDPVARSTVNPWSWFRWLALHDQSRYLRAMTDELHRLRSAIAPEGRSRLKAFEPDWTAPLTALFIPALMKVGDSVAYTEVEHAMARAAILLRQHFAVHGTYPDTFDMPIDPFTGKPLHYQREGEGFVIWSEVTMPGSDGGRIEWRWN